MVLLSNQNKISVSAALEAVTGGGAYTYGEENVKGILKPGAKADFVILDRDPLSVPATELREICVCETIKEDRVLYKA